MDAALLGMLTSTITLAPYAGQDAYGMPTFGSAVSVPAYVSLKPRRFVTQAGQERVSRATVIVDGAVTVRLNDKVTLEDGTTPAIQMINVMKDLDGSIHHRTLTF